MTNRSSSIYLMRVLVSFNSSPCSLSLFSTLLHMSANPYTLASVDSLELTYSSSRNKNVFFINSICYITFSSKALILCSFSFDASIFYWAALKKRSSWAFSFLLYSLNLRSISLLMAFMISSKWMNFFSKIVSLLSQSRIYYS